MDSSGNAVVPPPKRSKTGKPAMSSSTLKPKKKAMKIAPLVSVPKPKVITNFNFKVAREKPLSAGVSRVSAPKIPLKSIPNFISLRKASLGKK